jgi:predicted enzyme related to lactoylglutathione lyase
MSYLFAYQMLKGGLSAVFVTDRSAAMPRVVHFEICADRPDRAVEFYQNVFGWEIRRWDGPLEYWLITTGDDDEPGINGGLVHRDSSVAGPTNIVEVPSLDEALMRIAQSSGHLVQSRTPVPGIGFIAHCMDTEGNSFAIMERDESAP